MILIMVRFASSHIKNDAEVNIYNLNSRFVRFSDQIPSCHRTRGIGSPITTSFQNGLITLKMKDKDRKDRSLCILLTQFVEIIHKIHSLKWKEAVSCHGIYLQ